MLQTGVSNLSMSSSSPVYFNKKIIKTFTVIENENDKITMTVDRKKESKMVYFVRFHMTK